MALHNAPRIEQSGPFLHSTCDSVKNRICQADFFVLRAVLKGGSYGNKILYKNLDLTQDFPNKISFHFLWVTQDFQMAGNVPS